MQKKQWLILLLTTAITTALLMAARAYSGDTVPSLAMRIGYMAIFCVLLILSIRIGWTVALGGWLGHVIVLLAMGPLKLWPGVLALGVILFLPYLIKHLTARTRRGS